ncbi:hypothetical protein [Paenibacillus odorifer]|uniref:Uncharacterized protein n=1 Tax=Paenibacillus odorifer TaxID=189426 RepID=A0AAD0KQ22_9BACL|nr:hypothetical protein [Paenibacillus odorifer]AWV35177.1 hypothetical protein CD191_22470 [Paenibacillus odorifer]
MTQRDWQKDMERVKIFEHAKTLCNNPFPPAIEYEPTEVALGYWLQEAKERGERERQLKEALELMVFMFRYDSEEGRAYMNFGDFEEVLEPDDNAAYISVSNLLRTLYPDTPAPKEGTEWINEESCARCGRNKPVKGYEWCSECRPDLAVLNL